MMKIKIYNIVFGLIAAIYICGLLLINYATPTSVIGIINGTEVKRIENKELDTSNHSIKNENIRSKDVYYIYGENKDKKPWVMRNEDTGFGFPPYFKFNSANIHAQAKSLEDSGSLVLVTHYGWRSTIFSVFPNITSIEAVDENESDLNLIAIFIYSIWGLVGIYILIRYFGIKRS